MKHLVIFNTIEEMESASLNTPCITYVRENDSLQTHKENYIIATYQADDSIDYGMNILGATFATSQIQTMFIDDVETGLKTVFDTPGEHIVKIVFNNLTNCQQMFANCVALTQLDTSHFDTSKVTQCVMMLSNTSLVQFNASDLDFSQCTAMAAMFGNSKRLRTVNMGDSDLTSLRTMVSIFANCENLSTVKFGGNLSTSCTCSGAFSGISTTGRLFLNPNYTDNYINLITAMPSTWSIMTA